MLFHNFARPKVTVPLLKIFKKLNILSVIANGFVNIVCQISYKLISSFYKDPMKRFPVPTTLALSVGVVTCNYDAKIIYMTFDV